MTQAGARLVHFANRPDAGCAQRPVSEVHGPPRSFRIPGRYERICREPWLSRLSAGHCSTRLAHHPCPACGLVLNPHIPGQWPPRPADGAYVRTLTHSTLDVSAHAGQLPESRPGARFTSTFPWSVEA